MKGTSFFLMETGLAYRLRMLATNCPLTDKGLGEDGDGLREARSEGLIEAPNSRCGRREHAHGEIKSDFASGICYLPIALVPTGVAGATLLWRFFVDWEPGAGGLAILPHEKG